LRLGGEVVTAKITGLFGQAGLRRVPIAEAGPGDIVALSGFSDVHIGETVSSAETPLPLPPIKVDEPTIAVVFSVNSSPLSGRDGKFVTSRHLRDRLAKESLANVSIRIEATDQPDAFLVAGRGELQLAIIIETMRREGYELSWAARRW